MIVQRGEFANYLRKNSGVKDDATSSEIQGACSARLEQCEWPSNASWRRHSRITSSTKSLRSGFPFLTLLHHNGFAIADMGGKGRFRPSDLRENFYTESEANSIGLPDSGTMRYRPPFLRVGREKNKLYHPVKPLSSTMRETIGRQCHRWLPSSVVQMLKKCGIRLRLSCEETSEIWSFPNGE